MKIIAIHGNGQDQQIFKELNMLALETINLPGHGGMKDLNSYSINNYARYVDSLIHEDCLLLGHSLGGHIALEVASKNSHVKALISIGAPPINNQNLGNVFQPNPAIAVVYAEDQPEELLREFIKAGSETRNNDELLLSMFRYQSPFARSSFAQSLGGGVEDELLKIQSLNIPMLYLFGAQEKLINLEFVREMNLPKYTEISGGHNIMLDNPRELQESILTFLLKSKLI
jgi:pimeloyl-ACP methyl ester carboxylesterase